MFCWSPGLFANKLRALETKDPNEKQIQQQSRHQRHSFQTSQEVLSSEVSMATIDSPRRILGERDVNKPVFPRPSSTSSSPSKAALLSHNNASHEKTLDLGKLSQALLSPRMHSPSPSPASAGSPAGNRKRGAACLEDAQDGPPRKQAVIGLPRGDCDDNRPGSGNSKTCSLQSVVDYPGVSTATAEAASDPGLLRWSLSPDSSFDTTQDSELVDSQITNITEPEDSAPLAVTALTIVPLVAPRAITQEEARENAEALRLRLTVAMYKINTNQTDLPLSQLQIRSSRGHHPTRTLLPSSRLAPVPHHSKLVTPTSHPSQFRNDEVEDHTSNPSSSPPPPTSPDISASHAHGLRRNDFGTPVLPRSRDGYSRVHDSRGSPEPGPEVTSSVVKGRAADGLLSLMGARPRHG